MDNGKKNALKKKPAPGPAQDRPSPRMRLSALWQGFLNARLFTAAVLLYVLVCAALLYPSLQVPLKAGDRAPRRILSPRTMEYVDVEATARARNQAREKISKVYLVDVDNLMADVRDLTDMVGGIYSDAPASEFQDVATVRERLLDSMYLKQESVDAILEMGRTHKLTRLYRNTGEVVRSLTQGQDRVDQDILDGLETKVRSAASKQHIPDGDVPVIADMLDSLMAKSRSYAADETARRREQAAAAVPPVMREAKRRAPLIQKGRIVTGEDLEAFAVAGIHPTRVPWSSLAGGALLIAFLFALCGLYIMYVMPDVLRQEKKMYIFYLIVLGAVMWTLMVHVLHQTIPQFSLYTLGVTTGVLAILTCFLVQPQLALVSVPLIAAAALVTLKIDPGVLVLMLATGFLGYFFSMRRQDMDNIMKAGVAISVCGIALIAALHLIEFVSIKGFFLDTLLFGAANGLLTAILATGLLPLFERVFNVVTPHRLLELSNPEHPLLKQLLTTAPGTYHHCIFVGNLAESAAEAVGGDPLLVRIACYYHDVGKLRRPYFFAENQLHGQNPLDDKSPSMGALIIYQHVKEGVEMLREHKLPEPIIRIASEHHGTCMISFFYQQARSQAKNPDAVSEERFRYPGPTPSTLESAIVMLCDGCEAAVRSLKDHAMRNIENTVNTIVKARLVDGQFDRCNITLQQIDTVRKTLIETLARIYHARVEYPDEEELKKKFQTDHVPGDRRSGKAS